MRNYSALDEEVQHFLANQEEQHWLMNQTLLNSQTRRQILESLPIHSNADLLDVGTGFGAVSFDLASQLPIHIEAVDLNRERLDKAAELKQSLSEKNKLAGDIHFQRANVYELPYEENTFDFVIAWFVFQHLEDSDQALKEIKRVLRPGGYVCIVDTDDQYNVTYPPKSDAMVKMHRAVNELQQTQGGDRKIGRKLPYYLHNQGFDIQATAIQPQTSFVSEDNDLGSKMEVELFYQLKNDLIEKEILTDQEFTESIQEIKENGAGTRFESNAQFIVLGHLG